MGLVCVPAAPLLLQLTANGLERQIMVQVLEPLLTMRGLKKPLASDSWPWPYLALAVVAICGVNP